MVLKIPHKDNGYYDLDLGCWCNDGSDKTEIVRLRQRLNDLESELASLKKKLRS